jgi:hypothetical protein
MRKVFSHSLIESVNLECETTEHGRYYITPQGDRFKSVTTILGEKLDNEWLKEWRDRVGNKKADQIITRATKRGTAVHALAERYLLNESDYIQNAMPHYVLAFEAIKKVLNNHVNTIYAIEAPVYSKALKTAGRIDVVAEYDGIRSIIDFKTSNKIKNEEQIYSYFIQTTCYSMMFERMYNLSVPQIVIIITIDNEPVAKIFNKDRNQYVKDVLNIFT